MTHTPPPDAPDAPDTPVLALTGLTRRYGSLTALHDISLTLPPGARHAVIGPNGAGKTTLLNLIAGTERPNHGSVVLAGRDLTRTGPARRARRGIARSFQQPSVIPELTVLDNQVLAGWRHLSGPERPERPEQRWRARLPVLRGGRSRARHRTDAARGQLAAVGLEHLADAPASALSHGQRRLLDIAAALAAHPRVLLLDEPAAGLTDRDIGRLLEAIEGIGDTVALLLVEHHTEVVAQVADTVTVLVDGEKLVTGPVRTALDHPAVRDAYLGTSSTTTAETAH